MILRRLAEGIRNQDWFTVVVEVLVVVVGIFIGLQVDDWNEARKDRVDEGDFLGRLHAELIASLDEQKVLRERRLSLWRNTQSALDVVFDRIDRQRLSDGECLAIVASHLNSKTTPDLPSLAELTSAGRLSIVEDAELRLALTRLEQLSDNQDNVLRSVLSNSMALHSKYPHLMTLEAFWNEVEQEIRVRASCDLEAMRTNRNFLNDWSHNADMFDGFIKRGLRPQEAHLNYVHGLLDAALGITHSKAPA